MASRCLGEDLKKCIKIALPIIVANDPDSHLNEDAFVYCIRRRSGNARRSVKVHGAAESKSEPATLINYVTRATVSGS